MNINWTITLFVVEGGGLLSSLYSCILYYYLYLFCFTVFYLTPVLIRFVKLCICRDLYITRARMHIASP